MMRHTVVLTIILLQVVVENQVLDALLLLSLYLLLILHSNGKCRVGWKFNSPCLYRVSLYP